MSKNVSSTNMGEDQKKAYRKSYNQELYPGNTMPLHQMINALSSENPTKTIQAKIVTDPDSVCVDVPSTCEAPWFDPVSPITGRPFCFAKFGKSTNGKDECAETGGETVYFKYNFDPIGHEYGSTGYDYGSWGYSLSQELTYSGKYILHFLFGFMRIN